MIILGWSSIRATAETEKILYRERIPKYELHTIVNEIIII